jgi:competence ComEA-like helix-hairpin-helix protein
MATQGERRALIFLAAVALLGAGTRAWRGRSVAVDTTALERQIEQVDGLTGGQVDGLKRSRTTSRAIRPPGDPPTRQPVNPPTRQPVDPPTRQPVDMDFASAEEIENLPGIGPALAGRIIKDREANGPFGCLAALDRVKGVGPALLARLDSLATFSAAGGAPCAGPGRPPAGSRRR